METYTEDEANVLNGLICDCHEVFEGHEQGLATAAICALLVGAVLTTVDGDAIRARAMLANLHADMISTIDDSEQQLAELRQGGRN